MAVKSFSFHIEEVNIFKFGAASGDISKADGINSLNIFPQISEITIYESIFKPVIRCEITINDYIGLFNNFPLTGNEIVIIKYRDSKDDESSLTFAIESITNINITDTNRSVNYIINCVSIEALFNNLQTVSQAYMGRYTDIIRAIWENHINDKIKKYLPQYKLQEFNIDENTNDIDNNTIIIPNMYPISGINMIQSILTTVNGFKAGSLFYQNRNGFNLKFLQDLTGSRGENFSKYQAFDNKYKYVSDEVSYDASDDRRSSLENETKLVSKLTINKRYSTMQKIASGYFNNNLFEINLGQKSVKENITKLEDISDLRMEEFGFDTQEFVDFTNSALDDIEDSNRTKYVFTTRKEGDVSYPILDMRDRWGKDIMTKSALTQVDLTVVIPGNDIFTVGDLFYLEVPAFNGFDDSGNDDFLNGFFLITEMKTIINSGGFYSMVLRLNKDSLGADVNRESRYVKGNR